MKAFHSFSPGSRLAHKFRVIRLLNTGGMGSVYEVENERLAKRYALKVLHTDEHASADLALRFQREIKVDGYVRNSHIVEMHDEGILDTGEPFLVMELLEGETLARRIERKGRLDLVEICDLIGQVCEGVQAAHDAGIIHRDLKPENLFITRREGKPFVKVLDFGIAKFQRPISDDMTATKEGTLLGTPYYLSPEQVRRDVSIDARADVYALGVILYECATGRVPYQADTLPFLGVLICEGKPEPLRVLRPDLPERFRDCVLQAMAVDRRHRWANARLLGEMLRTVAGSISQPNSENEPRPEDPMRVTDIIEEPLGPSPAPPLLVPPLPASPGSRERSLVMPALVLGLVAVIVVLWFGFGNRERSQYVSSSSNDVSVVLSQPIANTGLTRAPSADALPPTSVSASSQTSAMVTPSATQPRAPSTASNIPPRKPAPAPNVASSMHIGETLPPE